MWLCAEEIQITLPIARQEHRQSKGLSQITKGYAIL
nr:MAG TPA: hypothetical protein [Caudoviricetes sp.]